MLNDKPFRVPVLGRTRSNKYIVGPHLMITEGNGNLSECAIAARLSCRRVESRILIDNSPGSAHGTAFLLQPEVSRHSVTTPPQCIIHVKSVPVIGDIARIANMPPEDGHPVASILIAKA
ncbi:hypothetical protein QCA50_013234 [Cerrena zonata]|uniref:Ribosomal protein L14 n=1 Tax=Cerrena zonata TaxID=2478898 RepID=A0AAW0FST6_9APHY